MASAADAVELARLPKTEDAHRSSGLDFDEDNFGPTENASQAYPPADRGKGAYLFLLACFMLEALVWGFAFSFGVFQEAYTKAFPGASNIPTIGTCCNGLIYLTSPIAFVSLIKWPQYRRLSALLGLLLMCVALAAGSFSNNVPQLIATHGVLYSIGGAFCYSPTLLFMDDWFITRKGLAFGVMWAGTGVSGVVLPLVMQWLLNSYGFRTTLRVWSLGLFILTFPLLRYIRPRIPMEAQQQRPRKTFDLTFVYSPMFLVLQICNILEALGFFLPTIYLPTYATEVLHTSSLASAATIVAVNVASVFGCIAMGKLTDIYHVTTCILISTVGTVVGVFVFWGLSTSLPLLYLFCILYGFFAGSFSSTWAGIIKLVVSQFERAETGLIFGALAFGRGIGNVVSGPLSEALIKGRPWMGEVGMAYGTGYGPLIAFTGVSALLGGCSFVIRGFGPRARL